MTCSPFIYEPFIRVGNHVCAAFAAGDTQNNSLVLIVSYTIISESNVYVYI